MSSRLPAGCLPRTAHLRQHTDGMQGAIQRAEGSASGANAYCWQAPLDPRPPLCKVGTQAPRVADSTTEQSCL